MRLPPQLPPVSHTPKDHPFISAAPQAGLHPAFAPDYTLVRPGPFDRPLPIPDPFRPVWPRPMCMRCVIFCSTLLRCRRICIPVPC